MSKLGSCKVTGSREMRARLAALTDAYPKAIKRAIKTEAEFIMADAKEKFVPVDDTALINSGHVGMPQQEGTNIFIEFMFGGGAVDYAEAVHEHVSKHSPPSWKGKEINWTKAGTGPKYLEIPFRAAEKGMANRVARSIKEQIR